jgi:hypothetical protein
MKYSFKDWCMGINICLSKNQLSEKEKRENIIYLLW